MSVAVRHTRGLRAAAVIERFAVLCPRCISVYERKRRPLKIGIDADQGDHGRSHVTRASARWRS
jgi:hypothetical protein